MSCGQTYCTNLAVCTAVSRHHYIQDYQNNKKHPGKDKTVSNHKPETVVWSANTKGECVIANTANSHWYTGYHPTHKGSSKGMSPVDTAESPRNSCLAATCSMHNLWWGISAAHNNGHRQGTTHFDSVDCVFVEEGVCPLKRRGSECSGDSGSRQMFRLWIEIHILAVYGLVAEIHLAYTGCWKA